MNLSREFFTRNIKAALVSDKTFPEIQSSVGFLSLLRIVQNKLLWPMKDLGWTVFRFRVKEEKS